MLENKRRTTQFQIGDLVIKSSETKEVYFKVVDIHEDKIKIKAIDLPLFTYVNSNEIIKIKKVK